MKLEILVTLSILFCTGLATFSISRFEGPPFSVKPPSGMYNISGLGFDNVTNGNQVIAYGDFNNDKYTDIVSLTDDKLTLTIFIYSHESFSFWPFVSFSVGNPIAAVIPGDYNYDGLLDLLVITIDTTSNPNSAMGYYFRTQEEPYFFSGLANDGVLTANLSYSLENRTQPFVLDTQGDRKSDLLFVENGARKILSIIDQEIISTPFENFVSADPACKDSSSVLKNIFSVPHSNAFVDLNGDCAADLFLTSVDDQSNLYFEIWLRNPSDSKFCLVDASIVSNATSPSISPVSIADMNNDGTLDLIYATIPQNSNEGMVLNIIYNTVAISATSPCGVTSPPMTSPFSSYNAQTSAAGINQVLNMTAASQNSFRLYSSDVDRPGKIRVGDINIDGYVDLLYVIYDPNNNNGYGSIVLAINEAGNIVLNQATSNAEDSAYYLVLDDQTMTSSGDQPLSSLNAKSASFFDFDELGRLGLWIVTGSNTSSTTTLNAVFNFVSSENFILKTLGLNGVIPTGDDITSSLGGLYYGASIECTITDINGSPSLSKSGQIPQSAYTPLDLPYMFIGLGRTNNYIENFVMGISTTEGAKDVQQTTWTPIIPNSQLIVNPLVDADWTLDVYVNPTSETLLVVFTTLVILIILGGIIIYLHTKEKKEDKEKEDKMLHIFN